MEISVSDTCTSVSSLCSFICLKLLSLFQGSNQLVFINSFAYYNKIDGH